MLWSRIPSVLFIWWFGVIPHLYFFLGQFLFSCFLYSYISLPRGNSVFWDDDIAYNKVQCALALLSRQSSSAASAKMGSPSGPTEMGIAWVGHSFTPDGAMMHVQRAPEHRPGVSSRTFSALSRSSKKKRKKKKQCSGHVTSEWENGHEHAWATYRGSLHGGKDIWGRL